MVRMARGVGLVVGCMLLAACPDTSTSVLVILKLADGAAPPNSIEVKVFDKLGLRGVQSFSQPSLPGNLVISGLAAERTQLRIAVKGMGPRATLGAALVDTIPHQQAAVIVTLSEGLADSDGDGIADIIDHCPQVPDPLQADSNGDGTGDACGADMGVGDSSVDATGNPSLCATAGVKLCDGFEGGSIDLTKWGTRVEPKGMIGVDNTMAYRGGFSLHAHFGTTSFQGYSGAEVREVITFPQDPVYIRAFMFLPSNLPPVDVQFMRVEQDGDPFGGLGLEVLPNRTLTNYDYNLPQKHFSMASAMKMPLGRWVCVEWRVAPLTSMPDGGFAGETQVWLDGTELVDQRLSGIAVSPPLLHAAIGMDCTAGSQVPPVDMWFDEIAIDDKPIGCAK